MRNSVLNSRVVVDSSPLIVLIKSDLASLLQDLFESVVVPEAVWEEIAAGKPLDPARRALPNLKWIERKRVHLNESIVSYDLGRGESETLSFALEVSDSTALIDDAAARACGRKLNIPFIGTGGLILIAKRRGVINSVTDTLDSVRASGLWISDDLIELLKRRAGE